MISPENHLSESSQAGIMSAFVLSQTIAWNQFGKVDDWCLYTLLSPTAPARVKYSEGYFVSMLTWKKKKKKSHIKTLKATENRKTGTVFHLSAPVTGLWGLVFTTTGVLIHLQNPQSWLPFLLGSGTIFPIMLMGVLPVIPTISYSPILQNTS